MAVPKTPAPAVPETNTNAFQIDTNIAMPTSCGGFTKSSEGDNYPWDKLEIGHSFLVPVSVPDSITNADERAAAFKEAARKEANRISGKIRNRKAASEKAGNAVNYGARTVNDDTLGRGVRVWRLAPEAPKAAPPVPPVAA